ncbi:hypothetical protein H271_00275 [Vibrio parahaemolyticus 1911C]|nr:hypothetical protein H271_00275 [Vibrio parahaemolyticus 1911C]
MSFPNFLTFSSNVDKVAHGRLPMCLSRGYGAEGLVFIVIVFDFLLLLVFLG